jgi:hypothetical protein
LTVDSRFCGPPGTANGGYFSGLFAQYSSHSLRVRLQRPVPVDTPLAVEAAGDGSLELRHEGQLLARAEAARLELNVPTPPGYLAALEASRRFIGFGRHAYPGCFVCGTDRARGDGLRIFAGDLGAGGRLVAAPWVPGATLGAEDGKVRAEFMSAALDCPGYFAARSDGVPMLLGEFAAHLDRRVHIDEPCVVIGWKIAVDGRKYEVGTALFDEEGELCGRARALWIEPRSVVTPIA